MTELIRRKLKWSSLSRLEQIALVSSILIWIGVALFGGGLYIAFRNHSLEQRAYAQATAMVTATTEALTPMATSEGAVVRVATATPTSERFAAGWVTATPTVAPSPTSTSSPTPTTDSPGETGAGASTASTTTQTDPTLQVLRNATRVPRQVHSTPTPSPASAPPDRIVIPAIELDSTVVPIGWYTTQEGSARYSIWQVADYAVSWHKTSAYPGHSGNIVLNGHHNIKGEVFRYLVDLTVGDQVMLYVAGQAYYYQVEERMILKEKGEPTEIRRQNANWIAATQDERLTMVTCWPYTNNTHRLVVVARPAPPPVLKGLPE